MAETQKLIEMPRRRVRQVVSALFLLAVAAVTAVGLWKTSQAPTREFEVCRATPTGVMGTTSTLLAIARERARGEQALSRAEEALRRVEARMSTHLDSSEVSRLNQAQVGADVALSPETREVLRAAEAAYRDTEGAFDATCRPLLEVWREAAARNTAPSEETLRRARAASNWNLLDLTEIGARKRAATAQVDFGGLAKGYAIDQALAEIREAGALGGLVDVGGDLRCFGRPPEGEAWTVDLRSPFGDSLLLSLAIREGAVCTSGNYARFVEIGGRRYSHILDPRTGQPADAIPSA
ncbi:MAG: FAD:protein FMN transferase, partial [Armatimonadetes bacterium]|nr:FAD:protein FMN transferase [Armatimonadota bacterium]